MLSILCLNIGTEVLECSIRGVKILVFSIFRFNKLGFSTFNEDA